MGQSVMLNVRMDDELKSQATEVLAALGLSASDAVRILFTRLVRDQAFPLELKVPNTETEAAMREADEIIRNRTARFRTATELFDSLDESTRR